MKKIFVTFALFCALIFATGCGGGSNGGNNQNENPDSGDTVTDSDVDSGDSGSADTDPSDSGHENPDTAPEQPDNGDSQPDGGDTAPDNGDSTPDEGDSAPDGGDTTPDEGDSAPDNGDTTPEPADEDTVPEQPDEDADTVVEPLNEGIYFGIIGFNETLPYPQKAIGLLNSETESSYKSFIDSLTSADGTSLYFADYTALEMMRDYSPVPPKLKNVALVTFTDGLDNISLANDDYNPESYGSHAAYRAALHNMIIDAEGIHGVPVAAYTIGLRGSDVTDTIAFEETLEKLASEPKEDYVFQVSDMDEVKERFNEIAEALYSVSKTVNLKVKVPGGYDDGQHLRFTFDNPSAATSSNLYIEATFRRSGGRTLDEISYHGFANGETTITSVSSQGAYYFFVFEELKYVGTDNPISDADLNRIMLWKETTNGGWDKESEFNPSSSSTVTEEKNSALIMLVLDCTTSLGSDFGRMKQAGKDFVTTLVNGGSTSTITPCNPNPCTSISNSTGVCTVNGTGYTCGCQSGYTWNGGSCQSNGGSSLPECSSTSSTPCKDSSTGYIWSAKASTTYPWQNAVDYCNSYSEGGLSGWHLPTISELRTLIQNCSATQMPPVGSNIYICGVREDESVTCLSSSCQDESCYSCDYYEDGRHSKFGETGYFWSSSTYVLNTNPAWGVNFNLGGVVNTNKTHYSYVRCVR